MRQKILLVVLVGLCLTGGVRAANQESDRVLTNRLAAVSRQIAEKQFNEAGQTLLAIEKEAGLSEPDQVLVDRQFLALHAAQRERQKRVQVAKKLLARPSADAAARIDALKHLIDATDFGSQYYAWIHDLWPQEEVDQMKKDYRFALEEMIRVNPDAVDSRIALGNWHIEQGDADRAGALFGELSKREKLSDKQQAEIAIGLVNAALLKGDRAAAIQRCKELVGRNLKLPPAHRHRSNPVDEARFFLDFAEPDLNGLKLPVHTDAKAFPTPQQAKYSEAFVPLTSVKLILGKDIKADDARVRLLTAKLGFFGVQVADTAAFTIRIDAAEEPKAPDKPQGYALTVTKSGAVINGRDAQGTLWGIVSLLQLVDRTASPKIRLAEIVDYPVTAVRGFYQACWSHALELMLFCKLNVACSQNGPQIYNHDPANPITPLQKEIGKAQSGLFTAFGLRHYYGIFAWTLFYPVPLSSERTFELQRDICLEIAKHGGHVYYPYDDMRFPIHPADLEKFKTAAAIDAKHVTRLFRAVREQYPGFQMIFCPPFYWGPDGGHQYPESRDDYLKSLGEFLDPAIDVVWTGPRVKGYWKSDKQVAWMTGLTRHKPMIYQNGTGQHNLLPYITDRMPEWLDWHDGHPGFFDQEIAGYMHNTHMPQDAADTVKMADCFWNPGAYIPKTEEGARRGETAARRSVALLYGKEMFNILEPAWEAMTYFDKYPYGELKKPESIQEAAKEVSELERRLAIAEAAWKNAEAYNAFALQTFPGSLGRAIREFAPNTIKAAKKAVETPAPKTP